MAQPKSKDPVLAYDPNGAPIYGYVTNDNNMKGKPCCYSPLPGRTHMRCQRTDRCPNGRCPRHGGRSLKGTDSPSFRTGQYAKGFKDKANVQRLLEAQDDPLYLELKDEMGINALELMTLTDQFKNGLDPENYEKLVKLLNEIEEIFFSKSVMAFIDVMKDEGLPVRSLSHKVEAAVKIARRGADESVLFERIGSATERRRKLVETELKRVQFMNNNMPADEVAHLFLKVVQIVTKVFAKDPVGIRAFAAEIDILSGTHIPGANQALQGRPGVTGMVEPQSALTIGAKNQAESITIEEDEFIEIPEGKVSNRKLNFGGK